MSRRRRYTDAFSIIIKNYGMQKYACQVLYGLDQRVGLKPTC